MAQEEVTDFEVVCLCGSSRFRHLHEKAMAVLTLQAKIVLGLGVMGHEVGLDMRGPVKQMLDRLHLAKIDMARWVGLIAPHCAWCDDCRTFFVTDTADEVYLLGKYIPMQEMTWKCGRCGCRCLAHRYIGESTSREIQYAVAQGKPVRYINEDGTTSGT